ncbi:hypothetical protein PVAND_001059 [Polypedilum vanderplanki]|uniref:Uncharacterized protein n=1 Tax=Polypedilum vanderplanki TaxID=319348 RepID=A0A9J6BN41_POLVA|nr:hypothetical protein PVAND_001059 [Polypedilum vanderplanki]
MVLLSQLRNAAKRIPMIQFRAGNKNLKHESLESSSSAQTVSEVKPKSKGTNQPTIEDWQLPTRYRRRLLDDKEIDAINSGGAF